MRQTQLLLPDLGGRLIFMFSQPMKTSGYYQSISKEPNYAEHEYRI